MSDTEAQRSQASDPAISAAPERSTADAERNAHASIFGGDGSIVADVYCLTCGYNLRGLSGDPVRCPECGSGNHLGSVVVPARYIRDVLRAMEEAPAQCVSVSVFGVLIVPLVIVIPWPNFLPSLVVVPGTIAGWLWAYFHTRRSFGGRSGWRRILFDFHLVALLFLSFFPLVGLGAVLNLHVHLGVRWTSYLWICAITGLVLLVIGLRVYHVARKRIAALQRDEALRRAQLRMREELYFETHD